MLVSTPSRHCLTQIIVFRIYRRLLHVIASSVLAHALTRKTGKLNFENIWQIFPPNELGLTKFFGVDTVCRVVRYRHRPETRTCPAAWTIDLEYVDWNGEASGPWRARCASTPMRTTGAATL